MNILSKLTRYTLKCICLKLLMKELRNLETSLKGKRDKKRQEGGEKGRGRGGGKNEVLKHKGVINFGRN